MEVRISDVRLKEPCTTKKSLFAARQDAVDAYAAAVAELTNNIGTVSSAKYRILSRAAARAHKRSIEAAADLERHIREHGCDDAA